MNERAIASLGGYEVLAELDVGGMGEVLIARKRAVGGFERLVALKTVRSELAGVGAARDMFLDEGRLLARLHHRGIAQVYDFGEDGERLYLAMEYVAGIDFDELAMRQPPPRIACLAMAEVCHALHAAHELLDHDGSSFGVVHRDVSPGNLMLTFDGQTKVLDFGIALMRNRRAPVTEFGMLKGKPPYMAPEQVRSEAIDPRTDVFSACAVLWEVLTGERLFTGDSIFAIGRAIEQGEIAPPSTLRPELPKELDDLVLMGLAKSPKDRFQSASSLANALEIVARSLGSESLAQYARRELAADAREHEAHVADLIQKAEGRQRRVGRKTSVNTIPAIEHLAGGLEVADTAPGEQRPPAPPEQAKGAEKDEERARWPIVLAALGLLFMGGLGVWQAFFAQSSSPESETKLVAVDARPIAMDVTFVVDASSIPVAADAGHAPPLDAAVARPDARPRRRRIDAGPKNIPVPETKRDAAPTKRDATPTKPDPTRSDPTLTGSGTVTVLVPKGTPFANVKIDGRSIGPTPLIRYTLSAGPHVIVWTSPDTNAVRDRRSIVLKDGQRLMLRAK